MSVVARWVPGAAGKEMIGLQISWPPFTLAQCASEEENYQEIHWEVGDEGMLW